MGYIVSNEEKKNLELKFLFRLYNKSESAFLKDEMVTMMKNGYVNAYAINNGNYCTMDEFLSDENISEWMGHFDGDFSPDVAEFIEEYCS